MKRAATAVSVRPAPVPGRSSVRPSTAAAKHLRIEIIETALAMSRRGLSPGRSGNVSCRFGDGMLITPSGLAYETLKPADIVEVDPTGKTSAAARKPSSEWRFHLAVYQARADRHAIVHTHSMHATVLACAHLPIPAFHYMVAVAGGPDIPVVPYATFGTEDLSHHVVSGVRERDACLMANHGQIALGATLPGALELAAEVEVLAEQYFKVRMLGRAHVLEPDEMARVLRLFAGYGQNANPDPVA